MISTLFNYDGNATDSTSQTKAEQQLSTTATRAPRVASFKLEPSSEQEPSGDYTRNRTDSVLTRSNSNSAFCVVCGRCDRPLVQRKRGMKCQACVGKSHNAELVHLRTRQQEVYPPEAVLCNSYSSIDTGATSPPQSPTWTSLKPHANPAPVLDLGASVSGLTSSFNIDNITLTVEDPRTEELVGNKAVSLPGLGASIQLNETATTYAFVCRDGTTGTPVAAVRHRFKECEKLMTLLKSIGGESLPFIPPKKIFARFEARFVEHRRCELQTFFAAAVADHFIVRHPLLLEFLGLTNLLKEQQNAELLQLQPVGPPSTSSTVPVLAAIAEDELRRYKRGNLLGKGSFGSVYMGLLPSRSMLVAVKVLTLGSVSESSLQLIQMELEMLKLLEHENVVRFLGSVRLTEPHREFAIFTEYIECGSIATMVRKFGALPLPVIQNYMRQILNGLVYLHSKGVAHRDIKGDNILVTKDGVVKLADFGCAVQLQTIQVQGSTTDGTPAAAAVQDASLTGTPLWMAPEVMRGESQGLSADIWSLGCVGVEMMARAPWNVDDKENIYAAMFRIQKSIKYPDGLPAESDCDPLWRSFLMRCFERDPSRRVSAVDLLSDPFFDTECVVVD